MNQILWKPIPNYQGYYEINNIGLIRSIDRTISVGKTSRVLKSKVLKQRINKYGYLITDLSREGNSKTFEVHKLVATAFLYKVADNNFVNHIDCNKQNNNVENLEWVSFAQNINHAIEHGLYSKCKRVVNECTGKVYPSMAHALCEVNFSYSKLKRMLNGQEKNETCLRLAA